MVLSAAQILMILQERPEVVVELKSYLADMLQQQGTPTQPDSITDEMLYNQISTSPQVRAGITVFLRSRGFVSDEDLQRAAMTSGQSSPPSSASETELPLTTGSPFGSQIQSTQEESPFAASLPSEINTPSPTRATPSGMAGPQNRNANGTHTTTDEPQVLRQPAPYNLMSMRDLYTQIPSSPERLKRFGSEVFVNRSLGKCNESKRRFETPMPLDVPIRAGLRCGAGRHAQHQLVGRPNADVPPRSRPRRANYASGVRRGSSGRTDSGPRRDRD